MKKIVIMGASSGIGYGLAQAFLKHGFQVGLAARGTTTLQELQQQFPGQVQYSSIDITKAEAVDKLERLIEDLGGMDIYVHVAGIGYENPLLEPEAEAAVVNTNATAFARMTSAAFRWMRHHGVRGQIAALTSVAGTKGMARLSAYSASKAFAQSYLLALQQLSNNEGAGIAITDLRPGWVRTPLLAPGAKYPLEMVTEHVVKRILRAIARRQRVAVIDWRWNVIVGLWRMIPNRLWAHMNVPVSQGDKVFGTYGHSASRAGKDVR